jgi:pimeloyl-ACP methyl ester carboxylesterase
MKIVNLFFIILLTANTLFGQSNSIETTFYSPALEFTDCFLEDCGSFFDDSRIQYAYLTIPEDYEYPEGRKLRLAVIIIKASGEKPEADPLIYLHGGPGAKAILNGRINAFRAHPFGENRDIILTDFRGIGLSEPAFCPEIQEEIGKVVILNLTPAEATDKTIKIFEECFDRLRSEGINLNMYNTAMVVKDLEMLRIAMGVHQWYLWGISYGTRVAQTYLRDFPEAVRCVIMDSPVPMGYPATGEETKSYQRSLNAFFDACKENPECIKAFPELEERFYRAMVSLKENPAVFYYEKAPDGLAALNFHDMHLIIQQLLYMPEFYPSIPWLIKGIEQRDVEIFKNMIPEFESKVYNMSDAMYVTVLKYDNGLILSDFESSPTDPLHHALNYFDNVIHMVKRIDFITQDTLETQAVISDIPSLILSGSIDPITPPFYAQVLKESLRQSFLFEFTGRGHELTLDTDCAKNIAKDFLNNPYSEPEVDCITEMEANPIQWVTKLYYNPRIAAFAHKMLVQKKWNLVVGPVILFLSFIVSIIAALINLFRKKKKPTIPQIRNRNIIARLSALVSIFLIAGLGWFIMKTGNEHGPLLLMGLIKEATPVFYLSFFVLAGTVLSWVWYIRALKHSSTGGKILYGLMNVSLLWFSVLIFQFQLFPN